MFGLDKKNAKENEVIEGKDKEISRLLDRIDRMESDHAREIDQIKVDFESDQRIKDREVDIKIAAAVDVEKVKSAKLEKENAVLLKEKEILETAFKNMGFDVKDMKDILNKLVDAVVSGSKVNILKT